MAKAKPTSKKPLTPLQIHNNGECGCTILVNPNYCVYQPFIDGLDFVPDVGNGQKRGEVFTPRFVVDSMIVDSNIIKDKAVYEYDYKGSTETIRKYIGKRVFEHAVGSGNFIATILWHKLEYANFLTSTEGEENVGKKTPAQLRRYQSYTLVALSSIYFNDIDAGNLQTTRWRILRDAPIYTDEHVEFWTKHIQSSLGEEIEPEHISPMVEESIKEANKNWSILDADKGILDVLYKKHTGKEAPEWLEKAWAEILDHNGKLFNGIVEEDTIEDGFIVAGYKNVVWTFWWFTYDKDRIYVAKRRIPLMRQILESRLKSLEHLSFLIHNRGTVSEIEDGMLQIEVEGIEGKFSFASIEDEKENRRLQKEIDKIKLELKSIESFNHIETLEIDKTA